MAPYPVDQCLLYKMGSKRKLAEAIQVSMDDLKRIQTWNTYTVFQEPKSSGGTRTIYNPSPKLKAVQRRIKRLLERVERPAWVFSGVKGKCHVDNGFHHVGSSYFLCADISSFYDSCRRNQVYRFFRETLRTSPDVACILTDLTTVTDSEHPKGFIPTGSPTGQLVSFFSYEKMFTELHGIASEEGCRFSVYVDDITISSRTPIANPRSMTKRIAKTLKAYGHEINWQKTRYTGKSASRVVTGVALTSAGTARIPNRLGGKIVDGVGRIGRGDDGPLAATAGRIGAARQIEKSAFPNAGRIVEGKLRSSSRK